MMMGPNMMGGFYSGGFIWMIFVYIFIAAVIIGTIMLIIWLVKGINYPRKSVSDLDKGLEILNERYAKGEIHKKEYEDIKREISRPLVHLKDYFGQ
jgi:putative membrane protein